MSEFNHLTVSALNIRANDVQVRHHNHSGTGESITTIAVGHGHLSVTLHLAGTSASGQLLEVKRLGEQLAADAERLWGDLISTPSLDVVDTFASPEEVDEAEFLDAWGIVVDDPAEVASLHAKDPGDEPIVIDVDGTEVAA